MAHDLTTRKGLSSAYVLWGISPVFALGKYVFDKILGENTSPEEQRKAAIELIREAKRQGAKSIEMEVDSGVAGELGTSIEGAPIKVGGRVGNKMKVRVEFK